MSLSRFLLSCVAYMRIATASILLVSMLSGAENHETTVQSVTIPLDPGNNAASAKFLLGTLSPPEESRIMVKLDNSKSHVFRIRIKPDRFRSRTEKDGETIEVSEELPDAVIELTGLPPLHVRPRLQRYTDKQCQTLSKKWCSLPAASKHFVKFEARQDTHGVTFYLDEHYVGRRDGEGKLVSLTFILPEEGKLCEARSFTYNPDPVYLPLCLDSTAKPGVMENGKLSLKSGLQLIRGIPIQVLTAAANIDVGMVKQMKGSWALECDEHLSRTALDGMPETAHVAIPPGYYTRAWALCAAEPDPGKDPIVTARLTRFARSGRGEAISDTTVTLPKNARQQNGVFPIGTISYELDGQTKESPLFLVEFELKSGAILDLLSMNNDSTASMMTQPYLDFEFLGKLGDISAQWDTSHKPDKTSTSSVHVFGVTLEKSPVELRLIATQPGNIFHNNEKPEMLAKFRATQECQVEFAWKICDITGDILRQQRKEICFSAPVEEKEIIVPMEMDTLGWYGINFTLTDDKKQRILEHDAAFALLGDDTRKAGYDSPYGTWWFAGAHYGAGDKEIAGPMLFKAGLHKTTFGWTKYSEADMALWKITLNQLSWRFAPKDMANKEKAYDEAEAKVREMLVRFPHCRTANIFHESYAHYVPPELIDKEAIEDETTRQQGKERAELGTFAAQFYRERFPDIKLIVGNTSSSMSIICSLLRHGFDTKYIDYIGVEAVGQTSMPEKLWDGGTQGIWLSREVARKFGYDLPVTGCYEFTARTDRTLGPRRQAEWIVRDMLLCHAYHFQHINPAILHDTGNAYFNTLWGAGGLCRRNPLLYPKPAYVAVATLTKVLDQVKPPHRLGTGSTTVFALEFERADGNIAYALWTARGKAVMRFHFTKNIALRCFGFFGEISKTSTSLLDKSFDVNCNTSPVYVLSPQKCEAIEIIDRQFENPPDSFRVVNRMDDIKQWLLEEGDESLKNPTPRGLPIRVPGRFALTEVVDTEKDRCLQLKLIREASVPDIVGEYTRLRLRTAVPVSAKPTEIGLWVKGDSGWGKIIFEIVDSTGALWRTEGMWHDWPGDLLICHDGWRFMSFPIDGSSHVRNISVGARWTSKSPAKRSSIQFPIKLVGLSVVMNRKALDLSEMKEVEGILRLRDFGVCYPETSNQGKQ